MEGEPGALPLLSHALRETWLRHEGRTLTVAGYQASGGVRGAIAQSAEALYSHLDETGRAQLRDLVLRLVVPGPRGEPVRGGVPRRQVVVDAVQEQLVDQMVAARLVTSDADAIELAHEAVVRAWPRLRGWLEDDLEGQRTRHHLTQAAEDWARSGSQDSDLYRGTRLATTREWVASSDPRLTDLEQRFLAASDALATAEEASAIELARTRGRMVRRLRYALVGAAVLLVLALITGFVAVGQTGRARDEATAARARQLSAQALTDSNIPLSALLSVAAVRLDDTPETRASLATVLARHASLIATSDQLGASPDRVVQSPDGARLATYDSHNVVSLIDAATGRVTARYDADGPGGGEEQGSQTSPMAFSPDGSTLAVAGQAWGPAGLVLLNGFTLTPLPGQPGHLPRWRAKSPDVAYSADGRFLAASFMLMAPRNTSIDDTWDRTRTLVWDLSDLTRRPSVVTTHDATHFERMALSPDGSRVYLSAPVAAYSATSGEQLWRLRGRGTDLPLDLSEDGTRLAVISGKGRDHVSVIDTRRGTVVDTLTGAPDLYDVDFSADGHEVGGVGSTRLLTWRTSSAEPTRSIPIDEAWGVQLNPDSSRAYLTDPREGTVVTWDLAGRSSYLPAASVHPDLAGLHVGFLRPAGDGVHVASYAGEVDLVNERTGQVSRARGAREWSSYCPGSWRSDGRRFALGAVDGHVQVFDDSGRLRTEARVAHTEVTDVDYTPDGHEIAVGDLSGRVALLDASTWSAAGKPVQLGGPVAGVTLAPDGRTAFVVTRPHPLPPGALPAFEGWAVLDLRTGTVVRTGTLLERSWSFDDFSPDGVHVAVSSFSGRVWILDIRTGRPVDAAPPTRRSPVFWVGWSPDGSQVLSADAVGTLGLWDVSTGTVQNTVTVPGERLAVGQFRPGSRDVTVLDFMGHVFTWDTRPEHAIDFACRIAGRDLTADEWRTYVGTADRISVCPQ
jgi:WD40 repeat protein